ncbi:unnamed protein product, partial [Didymodactylos carnosus]
HDTTDVLEAVTGIPSEQKDAVEAEKKMKVKEEELATQPKVMLQQLLFVCDSIAVKLEVGFGSSTKTVLAMTLSNITADVKNWSSA